MAETKEVPIKENDNTPLVIEGATNYIESMQGISSWMASQSNSSGLSLVIDYVSDPDRDWYAVITDGDKVIAGDATSGFGFVVDAVCALWLELKGKR